jgi:phosphatidylglycerol:prolipoprotein diacylglycerol transferase
MYPTLSHLLEDLFGFFIPLPIQTFGFFVAIAFVLASYFLTQELKRKEALGIITFKVKTEIIGKQPTWQDLISPVGLGFILGYKGVYMFQNYSAFSDDPQAFLLSTSGTLWAGILIAAISGYRKFREIKKVALSETKEKQVKVHPYQHVGNITMLAAVAGLLGAKIFHNLENIDQFMAHPMESLFSFSGLTFYGGLICGAAAVIWYAKKQNIPALVISDATAPSLMLAYGVGRIGCHLSGDGDWGINNLAPKPEWMSFLPDWVWSYTYPNNVIRAGEPIVDCVGKFCYELANPVWPTPLYECVVSIALFVGLWAIRKRINTAGILFFIYLIVNGLERFFVEKVRINTTCEIFGAKITQAEIISTLLVLAGIVGIILLKKQKTKSNG